MVNLLIILKSAISLFDWIAPLWPPSPGVAYDHKWVGSK